MRSSGHRERDSYTFCRKRMGKLFPFITFSSITRASRSIDKPRNQRSAGEDEPLKWPVPWIAVPLMRATRSLRGPRWNASKSNQGLCGRRTGCRWSNYFCVGPVSKAYRAVDKNTTRRLHTGCAPNTNWSVREPNGFPTNACMLSLDQVTQIDRGRDSVSVLKQIRADAWT